MATSHAQLTQATMRGYGSGAAESGEAEADEVTGGDEATTPTETTEATASDHEPVSNEVQRRVEGGNGGASEGGEGESSEFNLGGLISGVGSIFGALTEAEASPEAAETEFETETGWDPEDRVPRETGDEATLDAYFAEATDEADAQEFLPILGALVPVVKAALPLVISAFARQGGAALQRALQARMRRMPARQPVRGRETDESTEGGLTETDVEALATALSSLEIVIGQDDRRQVSPTTVQPWRRICHLRISARNGQSFLGTGFFIGRRTIATAGHCVYLRDSGGWASEILVTPARNGAAQPYGMVRATSFRSVRGWVTGRKRVCDYGCIILPPSFNQPTIGAFGFAARETALLQQGKLNLAGYPGDKPAGTMWYHGRVAKSVSANVLYYDTDTAGGQSGSPVWQRRGTKRTVVGIHTNGSPGGNSATRITRPVYDNLLRWRQEGDGTAPRSSSSTPSQRRAGSRVSRAQTEDA